MPPITPPLPFDLTAISTADLRTMLGAVRSLRVTPPLTPQKLAAAGLAVDAEAAAAALADLDLEATVVALSTALAERLRPRPSAELVWTGPDARHSTSRDTRAVLAQLFRSATSHVLLSGFAFDHGATLLAPLHDAMAERGVSCDAFVDIPGDQRATSPADEEPVVRAHLAAFLADDWPWTDARPAIFYDPRRFDPSVYASVHAKCVVVDGVRAFVTSANFTQRAQERNVEVGALLDDPAFASALTTQFRQCVRDGLFRRAPEAWFPSPP